MHMPSCTCRFAAPQVLLDEERYERLRRQAEATGASVGALVRDAIDHAYPGVPAEHRRAASEFLRAVTEADPPGVQEDWAVVKERMLRRELEARPRRWVTGTWLRNDCLTAESRVRRHDHAVVARPRHADVELLVARLLVEVLELAEDHDRRLEALEAADRGEVDELAVLAALVR